MSGGNGKCSVIENNTMRCDQYNYHPRNCSNNQQQLLAGKKNPLCGLWCVLVFYVLDEFGLMFGSKLAPQLNLKSSFL